MLIHLLELAPEDDDNSNVELLNAPGFEEVNQPKQQGKCKQ
jgi:hypothetical protein